MFDMHKVTSHKILNKERNKRTNERMNEIKYLYNIINLKKHFSKRTGAIEKIVKDGAKLLN